MIIAIIILKITVIIITKIEIMVEPNLLPFFSDMLILDATIWFPSAIDSGLLE